MYVSLFWLDSQAYLILGSVLNGYVLSNTGQSAVDIWTLLSDKLHLQIRLNLYVQGAMPVTSFGTPKDTNLLNLFLCVLIKVTGSKVNALLVKIGGQQTIQSICSS